MTETTDLHFDTDAVANWLKRHVEGFEGPLSAEKFAHGQSNPTYLLHTPGARYVLRRKPPGELLKSAHAVDREYRVQAALAGTQVPVPEMLAYCEDADLLGSEFYVMSHVPGRVFSEPTAEGLSVAERAAVYDDMARVLAAIHSVDLEAVGLSDFGPQGDYYRRQLDRWTRQYNATRTEDLADMERLIAWLTENLPPDDGRRTLVHGDFRIDNLLFDTDAPRCIAVLDWELSTLGHPFADLAALVMQWDMEPGPVGRGLEGLDRAALGIPTNAEFVANYCARMGIPGIDRFAFYLAFGFFRMGAILQGVKRRALDGNASNPEKGLKMGEQVPEFARKGLAAALKG